MFQQKTLKIYKAHLTTEPFVLIIKKSDHFCVKSYSLTVKLTILKY